MNIKEHIQFLVMMIPTLLLVIAAVITLATPAGAPQAAGVESYPRHEVATVDTETSPLNAVVVR